MQKLRQILIQATRVCLDRLGVRITYARDKIIEEEFLEIYEICKEFTMTSRERMYALYKAVEYVATAGIPGDFVECGVWKGGSAMVIALASLRFEDTSRKIYLYDTYEGMARPTEEDHKLAHNGFHTLSKWKSSQKEDHNSWCYSPLSQVRENMRSTGYPEDRLVFVKGRIEDTVPDKVPGGISLLRLDTDWYESTRHGLVHLFPRLATHGVLLLDDYGSWAGAKKATDEYFADKPILLNRIDRPGRIGIKLP